MGLTMSKSLTITRRERRPIHPGEVLADILREAGVSSHAAALAMRIPANRLTTIVKGQRSVTADTAMRLARYFGNSAQFWLNLQLRYDLQAAEGELSQRIASEVQPLGRLA